MTQTVIDSIAIVVTIMVLSRIVGRAIFNSAGEKPWTTPVKSRLGVGISRAGGISSATFEWSAAQPLRPANAKTATTTYL